MHIRRKAVMTGRYCEAAASAAMSARSHVRSQRSGGRERSHSSRAYILTVHVVQEISQVPVWLSKYSAARWYIQGPESVCASKGYLLKLPIMLSRWVIMVYIILMT